jgi:hypothetical protein
MSPKSHCENVKKLCLNNHFIYTISLCFVSLKNTNYELKNLLKDIIYLLDHFQTYFIARLIC